MNITDKTIPRHVLANILSISDHPASIMSGERSFLALAWQPNVEVYQCGCGQKQNSILNDVITKSVVERLSLALSRRLASKPHPSILKPERSCISNLKRTLGTTGNGQNQQNKGTDKLAEQQMSKACFYCHDFRLRFRSRR